MFSWDLVPWWWTSRIKKICNGAFISRMYTTCTRTIWNLIFSFPSYEIDRLEIRLLLEWLWQLIPYHWCTASLICTIGIVVWVKNSNGTTQWSSSPDHSWFQVYPIPMSQSIHPSIHPCIHACMHLHWYPWTSCRIWDNGTHAHSTEIFLSDIFDVRS